MSPDALQSTLAAMRNAGSVTGVLFLEAGEPLFDDIAQSPEQTNDLARIISDIEAYFRKEGRHPEYMSFAFDGGNMGLVIGEGHVLAVLYRDASEADFVIQSGLTFLTDYLVGAKADQYSRS